MTHSNERRQDIYTRVTERIVSDLERGVRPWTQPWHVEHTAGRITRPLRHNGQPYSGINILMLWGSALDHGFAAPIWMTFRQANELGASVRKGEKGSSVVYANKISRSEESEDGTAVEREIPFLKAYTVFNVEQIDGLPAHYYAAPEPRPEAPVRIERAEAFLAATQANVTHGGNRAFYSVSNDHIQMPPFEAFRDTESYYAIRAHETIHWTRHPSRLDRDFGRVRFGDQGYAREELVAELGAAFLCADLALTPEIRDDHAAYIASWIEVLKNDKRAIFQAAAHANRAVEFLHGLQANAVSGTTPPM